MSTPTIVTEVLDEAAEERRIGEQLDLLDEPETEQGAARVAHIARRPGRPKGARNKRTELTAALLMQRLGDPRERLLWIANKHPADLAALLGCTLIEALQEIRHAAVAVLPYIAKKLPIDVDLTNRQVVILRVDETAPLITDGDGVGLTARVIETQDYQEVSGDAPSEL
jgi:hypothetical protein